MQLARDMTGLQLKQRNGRMQMTGKSDNLSGSAKIIADAIRSSEAITVNAVRDRADVFVDTFATNDVDVADIRGMQSIMPS